MRAAGKGKTDRYGIKTAAVFCLMLFFLCACSCAQEQDPPDDPGTPSPVAADPGTSGTPSADPAPTGQEGVDNASPTAQASPGDEADPTASPTAAGGADDGGTDEEKGASLAYWFTYWDIDAVYEDFYRESEQLDTICFFAAYFDKEQKLFIPGNITDAVERLRNEGKLEEKDTYLTFVNDLLTAGGSSLKDTDLLYTLLADPAAAERHAEEIVDMTQGLGMDGVEIDYERIRDDGTLWEYFFRFENILWEKCREKGLKLRIVLEPSAPTGGYAWPEGPEYVMMCYNLYGAGTEAGPKADPEFLRRMVASMEQLPGTLNFALSNGGFDFGEEGDAEQLNSADVAGRIRKYGGSPVRDENSGAMVYTYSEEGQKHEIWYADRETLQYWISVIGKEGHHRISVWRLGG